MPPVLSDGLGKLSEFCASSQIHSLDGMFAYLKRSCISSDYDAKAVIALTSSSDEQDAAVCILHKLSFDPLSSAFQVFDAARIVFILIPAIQATEEKC